MGTGVGVKFDNTGYSMALFPEGMISYPNVVCCCLQSAAHKSGFKVIV